MFIKDPKKVLIILKKLTIGTDTETCIKGIKCRRKSMQKLYTRYYGTSEIACRKKFSRADLKNIFYNNKTTLTFENYDTKLKGIFNVLEKYGVPLYK